MTLDGILPFARLLLEKAVSPGCFAVDATAGNGHDTLFLANLIGESGHVFAFDVQEQALKKTGERLKQENVANRVTLFQSGHEKAKNLIPAEHHGQLTAAVFNLGYLPKSDKTIVTKPETTIQAVRDLFDMLRPGGLIVLVIYHGHEEGALERDAVVSFAESLDQQLAHVMRYEFINQANNPPFIIAIEKR
ncbi:class I SAM-dependent methyltransferase [Domibacillus epiphyticus]|uniref:rRNA methyltransferase n=1 Tax=Domibacillus epiphyticus TaxID=1714355 RepID=A0A1V2A908_9BACI|nr:class I SAM-dependent methyltransferase [Domibacillus epiphyticus]OMP67410.1 rRNA methyltransferase [Domibacillus epiphyticus]